MYSPLSAFFPFLQFDLVQYIYCTRRPANSLLCFRPFIHNGILTEHNKSQVVCTKEKIIRDGKSKKKLTGAERFSIRTEKTCIDFCCCPSLVYQDDYHLTRAVLFPLMLAFLHVYDAAIWEFSASMRSITRSASSSVSGTTFRIRTPSFTASGWTENVK